MVKIMLDGFGGDSRASKSRGASAQGTEMEQCNSQALNQIRCYHVNTRFSEDIADLGAMRVGKLLLVFRYCVEAIWCRFRYGVDTFYFAPAPPKWPALCRDWLVMLICRPFFRRFVHHWHAVGLTDWLECQGSSITRLMTRWLLGRASLGLTLATTNMRDPLWLQSTRVEIVPNGIPDPFPDFAQTIQPRRHARLQARRSLLRREVGSGQFDPAAGSDPQLFRLLYMGYCFREKGIFETLDGVARAQVMLRDHDHPLSVHLTVAGDFPSSADRAEFDERIARPDLRGLVHFVGFVRGSEKKRLLAESDCLCFPTYYPPESFGLVVLEAMAAGLNVVATKWRALPELLPTDYVGFVPVRDPEAIANAIGRLLTEDAAPLRARFLERFTEARHLRTLYDALLTIEQTSPDR